VPDGGSRRPAGHGSGKPTDKIIAEAADLWAFAGYWTGLTK
jgi:prolyl oligopeptidase